MVGGEEVRMPELGRHQSALSISIHNPSFLLSQVIFDDREASPALKLSPATCYDRARSGHRDLLSPAISGCRV